MIIYKIQNIINGKVYVGQTVKNLDKRILRHVRAKTYMGNALRKHGRNFFDISIIDNAHSKKELDEKEMAYIKFYDCRWPKGYNLTEGGEGGDTISNHPENKNIRNKISEAGEGRPCSEETKQKISKALMGHPVSKESVRKSAIANTGRKHSEEARQKIITALIGRPVSEETRQKLSMANKGKKPSERCIQKLIEANKSRKGSKLHKQEVIRHENSNSCSLSL